MQIGDLTLGITIGFLFTLLIILIRGWLEEKRIINNEIKDKKLKHYQIRKLLIMCLWEIKYGINRCKYIKNLETDIETTPDGRITIKTVTSPTKIYTKLWDSSIIKITPEIKNTTIVKQIISIHNNFELINFNAERGDFVMAKNFAKDKISSIKEDYNKLRNLIKKF